MRSICAIALAACVGCNCESATGSLAGVEVSKDAEPRDAGDAGVGARDAAPPAAADAEPNPDADVECSGCEHTWTPLDDFPNAGSLLSIGMLLWDEPRDRALLFGGSANRVFELRRSEASPRWRALSTTGDAPPPRRGDLTHDLRRDRVLFSACNGALERCALWALDLAGGEPHRWTKLQDLPRERAGSIVYEPAGDRALVFGDRVWTVDLDSFVWSDLRVRDATPGSGPCAYDSRDRAMVCVNERDTRRLSLDSPDAWTILGGPPPVRFLTYLGVDELERRALASASGAVWTKALDESFRWSRLTRNPSPSPDTIHIGITGFAPSRREVMFTGGWGSLGEVRTGVWTLPIDAPFAWTQIVPHVEVPAHNGEPFVGSALAYDPEDDLLIAMPTPLAGDLEVWTRHLLASSPWTKLTSAGPRPPGELGYSVIWDVEGDRAVLYGGPARELWALELSPEPRWSRLTTTSSSAPETSSYAASYDPVRRRMITFDVGGVPWALELSGPLEWSRMMTSGAAPPWMAAPASAYDPTGDRILTFLDGELYALELEPPRWARLNPAGPRPPPGARYGFAYEEPSREMILMALDGTPETCSQGGYIWALELDSLAWRRDLQRGEQPQAQDQSLISTSRGVVLSTYGTWLLDPAACTSR